MQDWFLNQRIILIGWEEVAAKIGIKVLFIWIFLPWNIWEVVVVVFFPLQGKTEAERRSLWALRSLGLCAYVAMIFCSRLTGCVSPRHVTLHHHPSTYIHVCKHPFFHNRQYLWSSRGIIFRPKQKTSCYLTNQEFWTKYTFSSVNFGFKFNCQFYNLFIYYNVIKKY